MAIRIIIASDHGGFNLKRHLADQLAKAGYEVEDLGPDCFESCDYPPFAARLCRKVLAHDGAVGILVCGTGLGMSMTANRFKGIRAAMVSEEFSARMARAHNNANVLCLGERTTGPGLAMSIVEAFLGQEFEAGRHARRVEQIDDVAKGQ